MSEVNNFNQIREMLNFNDSDKFYVIELIKRRKDNPDMKKSEKLLNWYDINSYEDFDKVKDKIIKICNEENCRAYIRLNRRSYKKCSLHMLSELSNRILQENYHIKNLYHSMCGKYHSEINKTWIIDIDKESIESLEHIKNYYVDLQKKYNNNYSDMYMIETNSGYHLIVKPFNSQEFSQKFPNIDIHKDNPTLLMCNLR